MPLVSDSQRNLTQEASARTSKDTLVVEDNLRSYLNKLYQLAQQLTQKKSIILFSVADIIFTSRGTPRKGKSPTQHHDTSLLEKIFVHNELLNPDKIIPYIERLKNNIETTKKGNRSIFPDGIVEEDPAQKEISAIAKNLDEILELSNQLKLLQLSGNKSPGSSMFVLSPPPKLPPPRPISQQAELTEEQLARKARLAAFRANLHNAQQSTGAEPKSASPGKTDLPPSSPKLEQSPIISTAQKPASAALAETVGLTPEQKKARLARLQAARKKRELEEAQRESGTSSTANPMNTSELSIACSVTPTSSVAPEFNSSYPGSPAATPHSSRSVSPLPEKAAKPETESPANTQPIPSSTASISSRLPPLDISSTKNDIAPPLTELNSYELAHWGELLDTYDEVLMVP